MVLRGAERPVPGPANAPLAGMAVADTVWVVHTGRAPEDDRMFGKIMTAIGVAFAGIIFAVNSYKKKKGAAVRLVTNSCLRAS